MAVHIRPFDAPIGVEVSGLDLNDPLGPDTVSELTDAFLDRHVLCIRDQDISMSRFLEIATVFGTPQVQKVKYYAHPDTNLISVVSPEVNRDREGSNGKPLVRGTTFHTDHSYWPKPCKATMLHGVQVPSKGGETRFCNMHRAYDDCQKNYETVSTVCAAFTVSLRVAKKPGESLTLNKNTTPAQQEFTL